MLEKYLAVLRNKANSLLFASFCSVYPIAKATVLYKNLSSNEVEQFILLYALLAFLLPILSLGYLDWFFKRLAQNKVTLSAATPLILALFPSLIITITFFLYSYSVFKDLIISLTFSIELLSMFSFNYYIRYIRSTRGGDAFFKLTAIRHLVELFLILIVLSNFGVSLIYISIASSLANVILAIYIIQSMRLANTHSFMLIKESQVILDNSKVIAFLFVSLLLSSFFSQMDKIIIQKITTQVDYINYGYYSFSRNLILSFSAFMFSMDYINVATMFSNGSVRDYITSRSKYIIITIPFFFLAHFLVVYYFTSGNYEVLTLLVSFFSNVLFLFYFFDLFQVLTDSKKAIIIPVFSSVSIFILIILVLYNFEVGYVYYFGAYSFAKIIHIILSYKLNMRGRG